MKKKLLILTDILLSVLLITGCTEEKKEEKNPDAAKFKEEYESLNGKTNAKGLEHRTVSIAEDNMFYYATGDEIVEKINNKETFYVYFGDTQCPWCRSVIEKAIEIAKDYNVKKIYYVKIWDDDHNEILRDVKQVNDNGEVEEVSAGTEAYKKLLELFKDVLSDYSLKDADGNAVETNEKRIYAPNFILVNKGKAKLLVEGISDKQKDARETLTKEMLEDEQKAFEKLFEAGSTCDTDEKC